jgi:DNA polymerase IV
MVQVNRKIIHVDMDAFYASVEQRDNPAWRGKPVIVGGGSHKRGVVCACSYEARKYGVHSAMPGSMARRLCPNGIFAPVNMAKYAAVSKQINNIFHEFTDMVEPMSLDEAYLDVTSNKINCPSATIIAKMIRQRIEEATDLTASAGVSYNKFIAKIASDVNKPDGLTVILPTQAEAFLDELPVGKFFGIGKVTAKALNNIGIKYGRDLKCLSLDDLVARFGKSGRWYYNIVRGIDNSPVNPDWQRKSLGRETTFEEDISDIGEIKKVIHELSDEVSKQLRQYGLEGRTVTLKVRYDDFKTVTRSQSFSRLTKQFEIIYNTAMELLSRTQAGERKVRLLGVTVSNFPTPEELAGPIQLEFPF